MEAMFDRRFYREIRSWVASLAKFRRFILFISTIIIPGAIGTFGVLAANLPDIKSPFVAIQVAFMVFGILLGGGLFWFGENPANIFQKFAHEVQHCVELEQQISDYEKEVVRLSAHINCLGVSARAIEGSLLSISALDGLREVVRNLLENLADNRLDLFGIEDSEYWNFGVYQQVDSELVCMCQRRNFNQTGESPRIWPIGTGQVGLTYHRNSELLTSDVAAHPVFHATGDLKHDRDDERYRGIFSICIPDVNNNHPIGVLIATSSKVGRFNQSNVQPLRDMAQAIGVILSPRQGNGSDENEQTSGLKT